MATMNNELKKEKIVSALTLWRSYDTSATLEAETVSEGVSENGRSAVASVRFYGRRTEDGAVRVFAKFAKPLSAQKCPAVLVLGEAGKETDGELLSYFADKGYAVLVPDYSGARETANEGEFTEYPESIAYANYAQAKGLYDLAGVPSDQTCWYEWTYVALYAIKYLKEREDITNIGIVGIRMGGEIAWKAMLSPDIACGVAVNAAGWLSSRGINKFADGAAINLTDERHRYMAGVDSQSYAPFVKCPVLMLCALSDYSFDYDRAYDTYSRIGSNDQMENAIVYSLDSGSCIGAGGLLDMDIFLQKHLKGREIFIPASLNITVQEEKGALKVSVTSDDEAIAEEIGVCYSEADVRVRSVYREWQCVHKAVGAQAKSGKTECTITPFSGCSAAYVYAYAKYLNGFKIVSKIVAKKFPKPDESAVKSRMIFSGDSVDCFSVAEHEDYSVAGIFLEQEATPKLLKGYGGIRGAYSVGGIKTYKISSPRYVAGEGAMLEFDVYSKMNDRIVISVEVADDEGGVERYTCRLNVKGGGKWKRTVLEAKDFKSETWGRPLSAFADGSALVFDCENEENEYLVTNILWL
ncbi:MAG: dienelactone hydrolase family protein [Clostridia bacterium]|nr:dienelactone hydrolase family protein [Clostridia bacterium]